MNPQENDIELFNKAFNMATSQNDESRALAIQILESSFNEDFLERNINDRIGDVISAFNNGVKGKFGNQSISWKAILEHDFLVLMQLDGIPDGLKYLTHLQELSLQNYNNTEIPENSFSTLESLKKLSIIQSKLLNLSKHSLNGLDNLHELQISASPIHWIEPKSFDTCPKLSSISFARSPNLKDLNLSATSISNDNMKILRQALPNCRIT